MRLPLTGWAKLAQHIRDQTVAFETSRAARLKAMRDIDEEIAEHKRDSVASIEQVRELERNWYRLARTLIAVDLALGMGDIESARRMVDDIRRSDAFPTREPRHRDGSMPDPTKVTRDGF